MSTFFWLILIFSGIAVFCWLLIEQNDKVSFLDSVKGDIKKMLGD